MGYVMNFEGTIPASAVKDLDKVMATLLRLSKRRGDEWSKDQSPENRYPVDEWIEDLHLEIHEETKDWGNWVEQTLQAIAPYISGEHVINVVGEDGAEWDLILRDGKLYIASYDKVRQSERLWTPD